MRAFIAIDLPEKIKEKLAELQAQLKKSGADVKWVAPKNIHLTLKFLGEINEERLLKSAETIEAAVKNKKPFQAALSSCAAFPKIEFPRVIWVAIDKGDNEVKVLSRELEGGLEQLGIPKEERAFSSHITIGRVRSMLNRENLVKALKEAEDYFGGSNIEFEVNKITLFKSTLGPAGPAYEALKEISITTA